MTRPAALLLLALAAGCGRPPAAPEPPPPPPSPFDTGWTAEEAVYKASIVEQYRDCVTKRDEVFPRLKQEIRAELDRLRRKVAMSEGFERDMAKAAADAALNELTSLSEREEHNLLQLENAVREARKRYGKHPEELEKEGRRKW